MTRRILLSLAAAATLAASTHLAMAQVVTEVIGDVPAPQAPVAPSNPYAGDETTLPAAELRSSAPAVASPAPASVTERALWQTLADGDWAGFDALVMRMETLYPGWTPPPAMLAERKAGERNDRVAAIIRSRNPGRIIRAATETPLVFSCARANNLWALAEAHLAMGDKPAAKEIYVRAAATCAAPERLAAIQKTRAAFPLEDVLAMIDAPSRAKHPAEPEIRAEIAKAIADMSGKGDPADPMSAMLKELGVALDRASPGTPVPLVADDVGRAANKRKSAKAAEMLGWLHHKHGAYAEAALWFRKATKWGNSKDAKAGLIYALAQSGEDGRQEARRLADQWPGTVPASMFAADAAVEAITTAQAAQDWDECRVLASASESAAVRLVGAWCDHEAGQSRRALDVFKALALAPTTKEAERTDAYKGWVITARALKDAGELDLLIERGLLSPDEEEALTREIGIARFWTAYDKGQYRTAMNIMEELYAKNVELTDRELVTTGWAAYNSGECGKAWNLFKRMMRSTDLEIVAEARRGFQAVQGAIRTDRQQICGRDRSVPTPGLFTAQP